MQTKFGSLWATGNYNQYARLSQSKIYHGMGMKIEFPNFELSSCSHSKLLVTILSVNLSSEVSRSIFLSFSRKKYSISMNYRDSITFSLQGEGRGYHRSILKISKISWKSGQEKLTTVLRQFYNFCKSSDFYTQI